MARDLFGNRKVTREDMYTKVKITDAQSIEEEDIKYYLGKKTIAAKTEVKEVK